LVLFEVIYNESLITTYREEEIEDLHEVKAKEIIEKKEYNEKKR
jgi:hypothetical protein